MLICPIIKETDMVYFKNIFIAFFLVSSISCTSSAQENPTEMFTELWDRYLGTEKKSITLSQSGEGSGLIILDINKELSENIFCQISLPTASGQTIYTIYKKNNENIWYFHMEALFYEEPFKLENAEILNTYFKYINDLPYAFNEETGNYDIQKDTNEFLAIRKLSSTEIIEIVQNNINIYR
jgi:hypothetical protein